MLKIIITYTALIVVINVVKIIKNMTENSCIYYIYKYNDYPQLTHIPNNFSYL